MKMMSKIVKIFKEPYWFCGVILRRLSNLIKDDKTFIKWEYFFGMGRFPNLDNPQTFNEKLQWLKLNDIHPEYTRMVDKYEAKEYVKSILGEEYIIPTLGVWDKFEDIDFNKLPNQFVLKCTHDSGGLVVCSDKSKLDINKARKKITKSLKKNYFLEHREYPYKDIKPRIIAEKYMVDESGTELKDYKFFCFNGKCKMLFIATDRPHDVRFDFYDTEFNHLPFIQGHPLATKIINKPIGFKEMIRLSEVLSKNIPHVRVDFYDINGKIYFGELTFFHFSGNVPFEPNEWDYTIGEWLVLPQI